MDRHDLDYRRLYEKEQESEIKEYADTLLSGKEIKTGGPVVQAQSAEKAKETAKIPGVKASSSSPKKPIESPTITPKKEISPADIPDPKPNPMPPEPKEPDAPRPEKTQYDENSQYRKPLKAPEDMTPAEVAEYFQISKGTDGHYYMRATAPFAKRMFRNHADLFKSKFDGENGIKEYLNRKEEWKKYDIDKKIWEHKRKLQENVPGLQMLEQIRDEWETYHYRINRDIESGSGRITAVKPKYPVSVVEKKFPVASAYLQAQGYVNSSNYRQSAIGKQAVEAIENGGDYKKAISDMKEEWHKAASEAVWNS